MIKQLTIQILFVLALVANAYSQALTDLLPPPKPNLVAVHWPDLTTLEPEVRDHLISLQNSLAATVKNPKLEGTLSDAYGAMGQIYQAYSLVSPARECYVNASHLAPSDFRWVYLMGTLDQLEGRVDDAIRSYQLARALRPEYVALAINLGNVYLQLNRLEDAETSFKSALAIEKTNAAAYYGLGQVALSRRSFAAAIDYFEKTLVQLPDANRVHYSLGMAYRGLGDAAKAKEHLMKQGTVGVRVVDPLVDRLPELIKGERLHLIRGRLALDAKRYEEAADEFRKAVAANPKSVAARNSLGGVLTQTGDLREAAAQFEATLLIDPKNTNAHFNLAILLARKNEPDQAIAHLRVVVSVDPNDLSARHFLAQQLLKSQRLDEALVEFSRVATALAELGRCSDAAELQRKLIAEAEQTKQMDLLEKLKAGLKRYEEGPPCHTP